MRCQPLEYIAHRHHKRGLDELDTGMLGGAMKNDSLKLTSSPARPIQAA
jgi:hypothetical protein